MTSTIVNDFRLGVDRRRKRVVGPPGSLWTCINAHLTRGGDIEKRKKFVAKWTVPGNTFGFRKTPTAAFVFGSAAPGTLTIPAGVTYQRLQSPSPDAPSMTKLWDVALFDGKVYAIAEFTDGNIHHFYDGTYVASWDDGVVRSYTASLDVVAARIATLINANADEVVTATSSGSNVTITAKANNLPFTCNPNADTGGTATVTLTQAADASHPQISTLSLTGAGSVGERYSVTINLNNYGAGDNPSTVGTRLFVYAQKVYAMAGSIVYFCAVDNQNEWRQNVNGAGFLNLSTNEEGSLEVSGAATYQNELAFFSTDNVQVWNIDPDPTQNAFDRSVANTGSVAGRSMWSYGNQETFYLSRSGVRSVRQAAVTGAPYVGDTGNPIDVLLIADMRTLGATLTAAAQSTMEPIDGRFMLAIGTKIYVLSYFPGSKIEGWSWYEPTEIPNFSADWVSVSKGQLYIRSGNTIYLYGGDDGNTYDVSSDDNYPVTVGLPYMGGKRMFESKRLSEWDIALENTWTLKALTDPRDENIGVVLGTADEISYADLDYPAAIDGEMFALEMTCTTPGPASVSNFVMTFDE